MKATKSLRVAFLFFYSANGFAQPAEKEPAAVLELGAAPGGSLTGGGFNLGPTVAIELTPIENWLELEAGVTRLFGHREWDTDILFKKPWTLSRKMEFMLGVGPEWIHRGASGAARNSLGGEIAPDFMFWRSAKHRFGWYVEPGYEYDFGRGHEQSVSVTVGLLLGIP